MKAPGASLQVRAHAVWKCVGVLAHIVSGLYVIAFVFPKLGARQKDQRVQALAQALLAQWAAFVKAQAALSREILPR